jgi:hypothetical protein
MWAGAQGDLDDRKKILAAEIRREKELEMQRELLALSPNPNHHVGGP